MDTSTKTESAFLERLVGIWEYDNSESKAEPVDCGPMARWTETVRAFGGKWYIAESEMEAADGARSRMMMTVGYDAAKGMFTGTWIGSDMMETMFLYSGFLDDDGQSLVLEAEGPDFEDAAKTAVYRDVITFLDADTRRFSGTVRQPDGSFRTFMTSICRRMA